MKDFIGRKFGNVTVKKPLHQGGYGHSFLGFDESLEKSRVVKICLHPINSLETNNSEMDDFINEGLILSRLNHAQIVSILEHGEDYGHRYMILNFIEGPNMVNLIHSLNDIKKKHECNWDQVLDPHMALALAISCLKPLAYAHETRIQLPNQEIQQGIAHRDISPSNLIMGTGSEHEGKVHLIDFGTAKTGVDSVKTMHAKIIGSPKYMSPMRLKRPHYEGINETEYWKTFKQSQHDIHAMGCLFVELLTGKSFVPATRDISACLEAIVNPETYRDLYSRIKIYDPSIQRLIKESVVLPDIEHNKGGYQFKSAKEMLEEFEKVFYRLSGFAEYENVLVDFSRRIEDVKNIKPTLKKESSSIIKFTKTGNIKSGKRNFREKPLKWLVPLIFLMFGLSAFFLVQIFDYQSEDLKKKEGVTQLPPVPAENNPPDIEEPVEEKSAVEKIPVEKPVKKRATVKKATVKKTGVRNTPRKKAAPVKAVKQKQVRESPPVEQADSDNSPTDNSTPATDQNEIDDENASSEARLALVDQVSSPEANTPSTGGDENLSDFGIGAKAYKAKNYEIALEAFARVPAPALKQRGSEGRDDYVNANYYSGLVNQKKGNLKGAIKSYKTVLSYEKYYPIVQMNLGICYVGLKQFTKADKAFNAVVRDHTKIAPRQYDDIMQRTRYFWALTWTRLYNTATDPDKKRFYHTHAIKKWNNYNAWFGSNKKYSKSNGQAQIYLSNLIAKK